MNEQIKKWIEKRKETLSGTYFLQTIDENENQPCLRIWALNSTKKRGIRVKEVFREYLDGKIYVHRDLYYCGGAGYRVQWEERKYCSYWMPRELNGNWYEMDKRIGIVPIKLFSKTEAENIFKKYIPYFVIDDVYPLMEYAIRYRDYPCVELLVKAGYGYLTTYKRVINMSEATKKKFLRWLSKDNNGDYVRRAQPIYNHIFKAIKNGYSMEEFYYQKAINDYEKSFDYFNIPRTREECETVYKYLNNEKRPQNIGLRDYIDYLIQVKEMGYDMTLKSTLYPLDAARAHDSVIQQKKMEYSREINEKLMNIFEILSKYQISYKDLKLVIPKSQDDFVEWGKKLEICVGKYGYDEKMAKGECVIVMVYLNDKPLECCELRKKEKGKGLEIIQLRGLHNQISERHNDVQKLVNNFIKNYKNQNIYGACV